MYEKFLAKVLRQNKRAFFKYVKSKLAVRPKIGKMKNEHSMLIDTNEGIASVLVKYFNSIHLMRYLK